jgi:hypothetical protein
LISLRKANRLVSDPRKQVWSQGQQVGSDSGSIYGRKRLGSWRSRSLEMKLGPGMLRVGAGLVPIGPSDPEDVEAQISLIYTHWFRLSL